MISSQQLGERIAAVRKRSKLTQAELAGRLGVARTTVVAMEKGERRPSSAEVVKLAEIFAISVHELVREHYVGGDVSPRFRALSTAAGAVGSDLASAVDRLRTLASRYVQLERILGIDRVKTPLESIETYHATEARAYGNPHLMGEDAALTVRGALGLGDAPALSLRERFELEAGVRIFYPDLPRSTAALFIYSDELGSCVAVNRAHPHERRRWSLTHEMGHFLRDREGGDVLPTDAPVREDSSEIFADSFARVFLMPQSGISRQFADRFRANGSTFSVADILSVASLYEVSFDAMTRRLEELGLVRKGLHDELMRRKFKPREAQMRLGLLAASRVPNLFSGRYRTMAFLAFERELISEGDLAEYLETDRVSARGLYLAASRHSADEGQSVDLELGESVLAAQ